MNESLKQEILSMLSNYGGPKFQVGNIPEKWIRNIATKIAPPPQGEWLAFLDLTIFGNGKNGLLFTEAGLWLKYTVYQFGIPWSRLVDAGEITVLPKGKIDVGGRYILHTFEDRVSSQRLVELLIQLQELVRACDSSGSFWEYDEQGFATDDIYFQYQGKTRSEVINKVCMDYAGIAYMPPFNKQKHKYIAQGFSVPDEEEVIAYLDFDFTAESKEGIVVTERGLYWRSKVRDRCLEWEDLYAAGQFPHLFSNKEIVIDEQVLNVEGSKLQPEEIVELLRRIISLRPKDNYCAPVLSIERNDMLSDEERSMIFDKYALRNICKKNRLLSDPYYYTNADQAYNDTDDECIVAQNQTHIITTEGLTVTNRGVYLLTRPSLKPVMPNVFIPYARLIEAEISLRKKEELYVNSWLVHKAPYSDEIGYLLLCLQLYCTSLQVEGAPDFIEKEATYMDPWLIPVRGGKEDRHWVVAEEEVIRGVWDSKELAYGIEQRIFDASVIRVWSSGMKSWVNLIDADLI